MGWLWWIVIVPILDIVILTRIGARFGAGKALAWIILAALAGILAIRTRGFRFRREPALEEPRSLLDHLLIFMAGILLIFPGPATDVLGLLLLFPGVRRGISERLRGSLLGRRMGARMRAHRPPGPGVGPADGAERNETDSGGFPGADKARDVEFQEIRSRPRTGEE